MREATLLDPGRSGAKRPFAVDPALGLAQVTGVDVRREDGDVVPARGREHAVEQHRDGVGLLAGAAARAPDAQSPVVSGTRLEQLRNDARLERVEGGRVAEEVGFPHGQVADECLDVARRSRSGRQPAQARPRVRETEVGARGRDAALEVGPALFRKMQSRPGGEHVAHLGEEVPPAGVNARHVRLSPERRRERAPRPGKGALRDSR